MSCQVGSILRFEIFLKSQVNLNSRLSGNAYIDCTINMGPGPHRTIRIRNQNEQNGTIVLTAEALYFVVWNHPVPPIEVPNGHILGRLQSHPIYIIAPRFPTVFKDETEARREGEGLLSDRKYLYYYLNYTCL